MESSMRLTDKQIEECESVRQLLKTLHISNFDFEPSDRPDVSATINNRRIGIEVTVYHGDEWQNSRGGSLQRKTEEQINRDAGGRSYGMWGVVDPMPALTTRIKDKIESAQTYPKQNFEELWLLIGASKSQLGMMVSTFIPSLAIDLIKLNDSTDDLLRNSPFAKAYLHLLMGNGLYEWSHSEKWHVLQAPREVTGIPWSRFRNITRSRIAS